MLFKLPDHDTLYEALLNRDGRYDGQAYVCVSTTGVFCRLTCPARKPRSENCTFVETTGECVESGFRPCKRCKPMQTDATQDAGIAALLSALDEQPERRWSERHLQEMGYDLSTVRRSFKRQFGMTFLEMARQRRIRGGFARLAHGGKVIDAQLEAGFESPSAFRVAFARLLGCPPGELKSGGELVASWIATPLGDMVVVCSRSHLHLLEFVDRKALPRELGKLSAASKMRIGLGRTAITDMAELELTAFFAGRSARFATPLAPQGTPFTQSVWHVLRTIPAGHTRSYSQIARELGSPTASRAVARANGANQVALMIPCHRVIGADGSLTGYGGGLWRKQRLLEIEKQFRTGNGENVS